MCAEITPLSIPCRRHFTECIEFAFFTEKTIGGAIAVLDAVPTTVYCPMTVGLVVAIGIIVLRTMIMSTLSVHP